MRALLILPLLAASCNQTTSRETGSLALATATPADAETPVPPAGSAPAMPPMPPYQTRARMPAGDRLTGAMDGAAIFSHNCGACHLIAGMGTNLLTKQRMMMGETPDKGLLVNRDDLTGDYVEAVVRNGKGAMPPQSRVDITDPELKAVASYLGKGK